MAHNDRKPYYEEFAEQLIEDLKKGVAPWQKPWGPGELHPPLNPVSGTVYSGINRVMLSRKGYEDPRWMSLKQANSLDCRVRKGEKAQTIVYWQFSKEEPVRDDSGKPVLDGEGNQVMEKVELARPFVRFSSVFHVSQLEGNIPPLDPTATGRAWDPNQKAEAILENSGAVIKHNQRDRAFYSSRTDEICLPPQDHFPSADGYYATALHELGHWTGHPSRMNREFGPFGSEPYAREELRAEIASWMLGQDLGTGHDPGQHLSYVDSWISVLEKDPYEIVRACRDAEKIKQHVLGMEQQQEVAQEVHVPAEGRQQERRQKELMAEKDRLEAERDRLIQRMDALAESSMPMTEHMEATRKLSEQFGKFDVELGRLNDELDRLTPAQEPEQHAGPAPQAQKGPAPQKIFLAVPYGEKDQAKAAGAKWDGKAKLWYAPEGADMAKLKAWLPQKEPSPARTMDPREEAAQEIIAPSSGTTSTGKTYTRTEIEDAARQELLEGFYESEPDPTSAEAGAYIQANLPDRIATLSRLAGVQPDGTKVQPDAIKAGKDRLKEPAPQKIFLDVPYSEKERAKAAGARWDGKAKLWYAPEGADMVKLQAWRTARAPELVRTMDPRQEFAEALRNAGLDLQGAAPVMDGKIHRVPVLGGKPQALDGAYKGYLDGHPAGWYQNHRTGEQANWKATGHTLTEAQKAALQAEAADRARHRAEALCAEQDRVARECAQALSERQPASGEHPYLVKKGIPSLGIKESRDGQILLVPLYNAAGELRNVQEITPDGGKRFQAGGEKKGCFCLLDPEKRLGQGEILLAEGYATGVSVHMATNKPVAVAFDAGNLQEVAKALREQFPDAKIVICADNDHAREHGNIGVEKAKQAAQAVGGSVIVPAFDKKDLAAGCTDWNDLHSSRGIKEVANQVGKGLAREKAQGMGR